jgi:hypothetical protein
MSVFVIRHDATLSAIATAFAGLYKQSSMPAPGAVIDLPTMLPGTRLTSIRNVGAFRGTPAREIPPTRRRRQSAT